MRQSLLFAALLLPAALAAQSFVVDASNGPGTHYTSLAAAVSAVPEGAVLIVRAGSYDPMSIQSKSLTVFCDAGAVIQTPLPWGVEALVIDGLGPQQSVVIRGLAIGVNRAALTIRNNEGLVDIEAAAVQLGGVGIYAASCDRVRLRGFRSPVGVVPVGVVIVSSNVVFEHCTLTGSTFATNPGLTQTGGTVQLVGCIVDGGLGFTHFTAGPGILMNGGSLRMLGGGRVQAGSAAYPNGSLPQHAIAGTGSVRLDPSVQLLATQTLGAGIQMTIGAQPQVIVASSASPVAFHATLLGPAGALGVLAVGLPGLSHPAPGLLDPLWWSGPTAVVQSVGVISETSPLTSTLTVPNVAAFAGLRLVWHGVSYEASGGLQVSPPVPAVIW